MHLLSRFTIYGHSMEPTIMQGQTVLVSSIPYLFLEPKVGDIVAFKSKENKVFIKRIVKIINDKYFFEGDNKKDSLDSRGFGWIGRKEIVGKTIYKISNVKNQISNLHLKS